MVFERSHESTARYQNWLELPTEFQDFFWSLLELTSHQNWLELTSKLNFKVCSTILTVILRKELDQIRPMPIDADSTGRISSQTLGQNSDLE